MCDQFSLNKGNTIVYIAVLLLVFGSLGVSLVSLFTTSLSSTATPDYGTQAFHMAESGMRYAMSELRNSNFSTDVITTINSISYSIGNSGSFNINVFGQRQKSPSVQDLSDGDTMYLLVPVGEIPDKYTIPSGAPYLSVINFEYVGTTPSDTASAEVDNFSINSPTAFQLTVKDNFKLGKNDEVCWAVHPIGSQIFGSGDSISVSLAAKNVFPKYGGAIDIDRNTYFYDERIDFEGGTPPRVELTNIHKGTSESVLPFTIDSGSFVTLSLSNYIIVSEGQYGSITYGGNLDYSMSVYDQAPVKPLSRKPDIDFNEKGDLSTVLNEVNPDFIDVDNTLKTITLGGGAAPSIGAVWYDENLTIGGTTGFCGSSGCTFGLGIRAFFIIDYQGNGDGLTFSIISGAPTNNVSSVGGDIELSELMGYAGDSRLDPAGTTFLDGTLNGEGLEPPKIAVEFDAKSNNDALEYCADATNVNQNTRNDPDFGLGDKDTIQFVYWGDRDPIDILCRDNKSSYDDNRHDLKDVIAEQQWPFDTGGNVGSSPAVDLFDGTIYVGSGTQGINDDGKLFAINPDGTQKWVFLVPGTGDDDVDSSPSLDSSGNIYFGTDTSVIYSLNADGNVRWFFNTVGDVETRPTISDAKSAVYVGSEGGKFYALNLANGNLIWEYPSSGTIGAIISSAAVDEGQNAVYFGSNDGNVYALDLDNGTLKGLNWPFPTGSAVQSSPTVDPNNNTIYVGSDNSNVYAITPTGSSKGLNWPFTTPTGEIRTKPAIGSDGTIYIGSEDGSVYAVNPDGSARGLEWPFLTGGSVESSPAIDSDETIYVGSNDGHLYAINPDGSEKWRFPSTGTIGEVRSSPAVGKYGIIYVGSDDNNVYAIDPFIDPRNIRNLYLTSNEIDDGSITVSDQDNWLNSGPWAVRMELERSLTTNANGNFDYTIKLWMRQCQAGDCSSINPDNKILGTFFEDTRIKYDYSPSVANLKLPLVQKIEITPDFQVKFERFIFGFTSAIASGDTQNVEIRDFQLSFIRPKDPTITDDNSWKP